MHILRGNMALSVYLIRGSLVHKTIVEENAETIETFTSLACFIYKLDLH